VPAQAPRHRVDQAADPQRAHRGRDKRDHYAEPKLSIGVFSVDSVKSAKEAVKRGMETSIVSGKAAAFECKF
jgi:hypothetical protein